MSTPALRTLHRAPAWNKSDYICLCCRRRLLAQSQQQRSSSSANISFDDAGNDDDWLNNFNNLTAEPLANQDGKVSHFKRMSEEKVAQAPEKRETRRQRMAAKPEKGFTGLMSSLTTRLDTSAPAEDTPDVDFNPFEHNAESYSNLPYRPLRQVSSSSADLQFLAEKPSGGRIPVRKHRSRGERPGKPAVDVYQPTPIAAPPPSSHSVDEKLQAVIAEFRPQWTQIKMLAMMQDHLMRKKEASKLETQEGSKAQPILDGTMHSQYPSDSGSSVQLSPRTEKSTRGRLVRDIGSYRKYDVSHRPFRDESDAINEPSEMQLTDPAFAAPSFEAEASGSVRQTESHPALSSLLADHAKRSGTVQSGEERPSKEDPTYRAILDDSRPENPTGPNSSEEEPTYGAVLNDSKLGSESFKKLERLATRRTSLYSSQPEPRNGSGTRAMSSMAQKATELLKNLDSSKGGLPPLGIDVKEAASKSGKEVSSHVEASQVLEALYPKSKAKKTTSTSKSDTKDEKRSGKKSKEMKSGASATKETKTSDSSKTKETRTSSPAQRRKIKASKPSRTDAKNETASGKKSKGIRSDHTSKNVAGSEVRQDKISSYTAGVRVRKRLIDSPLDKLVKASPGIAKTKAAIRIRKRLSDNPIHQIVKASQETAKLTAAMRIRKSVSDSPLVKTATSNSGTMRSTASMRRRQRRAARTSTMTDAKEGEESRAGPLLNPLGSAISALNPSDVVCIDSANLEITPLNISQPQVPGLQYGLDRALFNPGVFQLQDPHSRVYNFDPYLQKIMPVVEFDYKALKEYKTSSQDSALSELAQKHGKRYIGSTSSMTGTLGHFHYLISNFRPLNLKMLSRSFPDSSETFTLINRAPNAIFLRNKGEGIYAIDADKEFDGPNVLMMLGKSMEKLLTLPRDDYERYKKEHSHLVTEEERSAPEAYEYTTMGDFLMRSQLDAHDSRLLGTGMFDLKTRAVVSIRMNASDYEPMTGYEIKSLQGRFQSYEREYYDMMRSTMLKYMLQVRMGRMNGIFLAYHNVERIFGFQYVPVHEMDLAIHAQTDRCLGDQEFKLSLDLLNKVLDKATKKFPNTSLRLHFETAEEKPGGGTPTTIMWIYAEPWSEDEIDRIQSSSHERTAEFERTMMGIEQDEPVDTANKLYSAERLNKGEDETPERPQAELAVLPDSDASSMTIAEAMTTSKDSKYSTTTTDADPTYSSALETHEVQDEKDHLQPLFAASIVCKSRINGVIQVRPENLKPDDKWELEYLLQEWDTSSMIWARYEDVKSRRKTTFEKVQGVGEDDKARKGGNDHYVEFLKSLSQQGRAARDRMDELEAGREPVVVGRAFGKAKESFANIEKNDSAKIEGLDDYLGWLYGKDAHQARES